MYHGRSQSMPAMAAGFGGQPQQNSQSQPGAGAGTAAAPGATSAAPAPSAGYSGAPAPAYYSAPPTPSPIVYVDPQQAAYYQQAAAAAYPLAGADWSSQQQMFQQAAAQQQQQMMAAGAAGVPTYDWSALYAAAYPPKESDAAGSSEQQAAQAQAQAQVQQAYSDYYNYLNQEALKAMSMPPQTQPSQPGAVMHTPPPPYPIDLTQPGAIELYNQQMQQAYAAQTSPVASLATPGAVGAFYPAVYSPEYLQQMAVLSSTMPAVSAAAAAPYPASAPTTPLVGAMPTVGWVPALTSPSRAHGPKGFGSTGHGAEPGPRERREQREAGSVDKDPLTYRTEVCRTHLTTGHCDYGTNCQFAHGVMELRSREFDSKYKTELCKNYYLFGSQSCFFASRCKFIHDEYRLRASEFEFWLVSPAENLVRVEIVDPRNIQRLEQLTTLVNNPPKPPVSPLKPTERTLFHQQLEEEKARADTLIAAAAEPLAPFPTVGATDAEIPLPPEDTESVTEASAERVKDERDDKELASRLSSVHVGDEPEPGSRPGHNPFGLGGNNRSHVSPVSLRLNHSPSLSPVSCPKSPVARVRQEEMLKPSTIPPLVAATVAPGLHSPQRSPSHHSLVEHRRARLMELARPTDLAFGDKEEGKQHGAGEQSQQEQIEGGAAAQPSASADPSRMPLLDLAAAAPSLDAAAPAHPTDIKPAEAAPAVSSSAPSSSSAHASSSLSSSSTSSFERESTQDVRVRSESGGPPLAYPRVQPRRRSGGGGGGWNRDQAQSHPYGYNHLPAGAGALPMGMAAAGPAAPHPSSLFLGAVLDPPTGAMHQATLSFPIMSNAPISFQQAQQQQYRMQHRRGGGGGGGGGRAPMQHPQQQQPQQRMQFAGAGGQMSPMSFNNDVRTLTGIVPIESIPSPIQRLSHPAPGESSGGIMTRSLSSSSSSPSSTVAQYASSPSIGASSSIASASPNQSSPKPLWLEQQSRAMHLPVFQPLEEQQQQQQAQQPQSEGEAQFEGAQQQQHGAPQPKPSQDDGEQRSQPSGGFRD